jgi:DNA-binding response OmpR family regulator
MAAGKTILVVDDDADIRIALQTFLQRAGYRVVTAADGNAGLAVAEREAPDLLIVDLMMPHQSGLLVVERLKRGRHDGPRIIMITAKEDGRYQAHAQRLGVDAYLRKPFDLGRLLESVRSLCPLQEDPIATSSR